MNKKKQEKGKPGIGDKSEKDKQCTPLSQKGTTLKRKMPPSQDKEDIEDLSKCLHFCSPTPPKMNVEEVVNDTTPQIEIKKQTQENRDDLILLRLDGMQESIRSLQSNWKTHKEN